MVDNLFQCFYMLLGDDLENVTESLVSEGLVDVRRGGIKPSEYVVILIGFKFNH